MEPNPDKKTVRTEGYGKSAKAAANPSSKLSLKRSPGLPQVRPSSAPGREKPHRQPAGAGI